MNKSLSWLVSRAIAFLAALLLLILFAPSSYAHSEDISVAEITITETQATDLLHRGGLLAIAAAFVWGSTHALSPGHGKVLLGAYLVGTKATSRHALFLGLTVTSPIQSAYLQWVRSLFLPLALFSPISFTRG
jgi:hypothetical protein